MECKANRCLRRFLKYGAGRHLVHPTRLITSYSDHSSKRAQTLRRTWTTARYTGSTEWRHKEILRHKAQRTNYGHRMSIVCALCLKQFKNYRKVRVAIPSRGIATSFNVAPRRMTGRTPFIKFTNLVPYLSRTKMSKLFLCPHEESNLDRKLRKLAFYPLNYGDIFSTGIHYLPAGRQERLADPCKLFIRVFSVFYT